MTLPTMLVDLEKQKFADASNVPIVRIADSSGGELATQTTVAALSAKLPAALGQTTMAASMSVALASDQSNINLNSFGSTVSIPSRKSFSISAASIIIDTVTDAFCIIGPTSGVIYITRIELSGTLNTAGTATITLVKRTTANTGASTTVNAVANLQTDTTTAYGKIYTTAPSALGTSAGVIDSSKYYMPLNTGRAPKYVWATSEFDRPVVLSAATDSLCVNFGSASLAGTFAFNAQFFHVA
jgi:hypothetical protein